ncbi:MAG: UDP-3-O-(3-hydroxymyristoyl)glucosamine N-acyltransferase [Pseudomonadales bacterium]
MSEAAFTLGELASRLSARLVGDPDIVINGLGSLLTAEADELSHLSNPGYRPQLAGSRAAAVILKAGDLELWDGPALVVENPYLTFARASQLFARLPPLPQGVHHTAQVDPSAVLGDSVRIGPGVVVGADARIGPRVRLYANSVVGDRCRVGEDSMLMPNAVLYAAVTLGARCVIHSGSVIGADGFGFTPDERGRLEAIAQLGGVIVGDDVSIGACSSIDRGALDDTVIEDGVKIDNQVQIGHNCRIGAHTVICGCVGIVGSTRIGRHCVLAGGVGIGGGAPIELCDRVVVSGMTHVSASITEPGIYSGGVLHSHNRQWKRNAIRFNRLDDLHRRLTRLERALGTKGAIGDDTAGSDDH